MKRWLIAASLLFCLAPARASQPASPVEALTKSFSQQEQIFLAGVLTNPAYASEFAVDAAAPTTQAVFDKWRQRIALFCKEYLDGNPHPINDQARTIEGMTSPAEWRMLNVSLDILSRGGWKDQLDFRIFAAMLETAKDDLAADPPDTRNAHKVIALGRSKLVAGMKMYLSTPTGQAALAEALRQHPAPAPAQTTFAPVKPAPKPLHPNVESRSMAQSEALAKTAPTDAGRVFDGGKAGQPAQEPPPVVIQPGPAADPADIQPPLTLGPATPLDKILLDIPPPPMPELAPQGDELAQLHARLKELNAHQGWFTKARVAILGTIAWLLMGRVRRHHANKKHPEPAPEPAGA